MSSPSKNKRKPSTSCNNESGSPGGGEGWTERTSESWTCSSWNKGWDNKKWDKWIYNKDCGKNDRDQRKHYGWDNWKNQSKNIGDSLTHQPPTPPPPPYAKQQAKDTGDQVSQRSSDEDPIPVGFIQRIARHEMSVEVDTSEIMGDTHEQAITKYIETLPRDSFSQRAMTERLAIECEQDGEMYVATCCLPAACALRGTYQSEPFRTEVSARRNVCAKIVADLTKEGLLDSEMNATKVPPALQSEISCPLQCPPQMPLE